MASLDDPELTLAEIMQRWPQAIAVFLDRKMLCVGCEVSPFHTIRDACLEYDLDEEEFTAALKAAISGPPGPVPPAGGRRGP